MTGRKDDNGKPMYHLIPPGAEEEVARVLTYGARKYAPENWRKVKDPADRYFSAARRHLNQYRRGEKTDPESERHHLAHAICCLLFMLQLDLEK